MSEPETTTTTQVEKSDERAPTVPIARVKRIIKQDDEIVTVSTGAVHAVAAATELFAHYFTEQAYLNAQSDKRKGLQYGDFANAVSNVEQLEFLTDIVPKKVAYKKVIERKRAIAQHDRKQMTLGIASGQLTASKPIQETNGNDDDDGRQSTVDAESGDEDAATTATEHGTEHGDNDTPMEDA